MMIVQLLLALALLVGVHEAGHMIAAKFFGMRVEKFSIGFPPKIFGFTWGETEYSFGSIPLGGFVKISGMVDESFDTKDLAKEPEPWEFRAKPAWQRLIVMLGGISVNVVTGVIVFILLTFAYGNYYLPKEALKDGIYAHEMAQKIGLQTGDKIIAINGKDYRSFEDLMDSDFLLSDNSYYTVKRNGDVIDVPVPDSIIGKLQREPFISINSKYAVDSVMKGTAAEKTGLAKGDVIHKVAGESTVFFPDLQRALTENKNKEVELVIVSRKNDTIRKTATIPESGKLGFAVNMPFERAHESYTFAEAVPKGTNQAFSIVFDNIKAFGKIFSGKISASDSVSSPIGIATMFGEHWQTQRFWTLVGLLSMVLAFMNLLPIPALDGGHVVFLLYEMVSGRKPSDKVVEVLTKIGIALLIALMLFAFGNDIYKLMFK